MDVHMLDDVLVLATKSRAEGAPAILVYDLAGVGASSGSAAAPVRQLPLKLTWMRPEAKVISAVHVKTTAQTGWAQILARTEGSPMAGRKHKKNTGRRVGRKYAHRQRADG